MIIPAGIYWVEKEVPLEDLRCTRCNNFAAKLHELNLTVGIGKLQNRILTTFLCDECFVDTGLTKEYVEKEITLDNVTPQDFL